MKGRVKYIRRVSKGSILTVVVIVVGLVLYALFVPYDVWVSIMFAFLIPATIITGISGVISASLFVLIVSLIARKSGLDFSNIWAAVSGFILALIQATMVIRFFSKNSTSLLLGQIDIHGIIILLLSVFFVGITVCGIVLAMQFIFRFLWFGETKT